MKSFPMFLRTTGRRVVIAGGGEQAAQKTRLILKTDAQIVLAAADLDPELAALVSQGRATWHPGPIDQAVFDGAALAFVATGCPGADAALHALAQAARCPVNVVDQPALCEVTTPSIVDRDPVVVAIGTEGTAPVLARQIKTKIEEALPPTLGGLAALAGRLRDSVAARVPRHKRRAFWRWVFADAPRDTWVKGAEREAAQMVKSALAKGEAPDTDQQGSIALVGAGPGARDLLTLRAVARLQEADVIFYDRLVDAEVLELARRDAERVFVGKVVGAHAWPQAQINAVIVAEAQKGRRVVRLKSGDPGIFGRGGEEIDTARAAGIAVEIVPGITAACAAAAACGTSLTQRDVSDAVIFATGTKAQGQQDFARYAQPGTTLAIYMAARIVAQITANLTSLGVPRGAPVRIASEVSKPGQRLFTSTLAQASALVQAQDLSGCMMLLVTWPANQAPAEPVHTEHISAIAAPLSASAQVA